MSAYSMSVTYVLWLTLGWFGIHHFYLGRDRHSFVWLCTIGGCFGCGWLLEFFRLPEYVRAANMEAIYASGEAPFPSELETLQPERRPPLKFKRFFGGIVFSTFLGFLSVAALPEEILSSCPFLTAFLCPAGVALGMHTVANIGIEECDFIFCISTSFIMSPFYLISSKETLFNVLSTTSLISSFIINYSSSIHEDDVEDYLGDNRLSSLLSTLLTKGRRYKRSKPKKHFHVCKRFFLHLIFSSVVVCLFCSTIYFNTFITTDYGHRVRLRDAMKHFWTSPAWAEFRQTVKRLWLSVWEDGPNRFFEEMSSAFDPEGEQNAYRVLNLTWFATEKEVNERYRELVKKFHPDKFRNSEREERKEIEKKFILIQQSYEKVSAIKAKRMRKNEL